MTDAQAQAAVIRLQRELMQAHRIIADQIAVIEQLRRDLAEAYRQAALAPR